MAIDPGKSCGIALYDPPGIWMVDTWTYEELKAGLASRRTGPISIVIVESFVPQLWRGHGIKDAQVQAERVAWITQQCARMKILCCLQNSTDLKQISESDIRLVLAQSGIKKTNRHERDACRHLWIYLTREKIACGAG